MIRSNYLKEPGGQVQNTTYYLTAFGVFGRPPWKRAILQTNSPCTGPARTWLSLKPWLMRLTHFLCKKCFCGKEDLEAKTMVSFKARFKFKTKAYVYSRVFGKGHMEKGFGKGCLWKGYACIKRSAQKPMSQVLYQI